MRETERSSSLSKRTSLKCPEYVPIEAHGVQSRARRVIECLYLLALNEDFEKALTSPPPDPCSKSSAGAALASLVVDCEVVWRGKSRRFKTFVRDMSFRGTRPFHPIAVFVCSRLLARSLGRSSCLVSSILEIEMYNTKTDPQTNDARRGMKRKLERVAEGITLVCSILHTSDIQLTQSST